MKKHNDILYQCYLLIYATIFILKQQCQLLPCVNAELIKHIYIFPWASEYGAR